MQGLVALGVFMKIQWARKSPRAVAAGLNKEPVTFQVALGEESRGREEKPQARRNWYSVTDRDDGSLTLCIGLLAIEGKSR